MAQTYGEETLTRVFRSDRKRLSDEDLVDTVVALANTEGGTIYLGVENDGTPTGVCKDHEDPIGITAMIANHTIPPVTTKELEETSNSITVMRIHVPKCRSIIASKEGRLLRRRLNLNGTPENVPLYPFEITTRLSDLGLLDYSAQPISDATRNDFDPKEYKRLRSIIASYKSSEQSLLELNDEELEKTLRLTTTLDGKTVPTLTGLLILGKSESLRRFVPTHKVNFQVVAGTKVKVNKDYNGTLLKIFEEINNDLSVRNYGTELMIGIHSMLVPDFDLQAFREAMANALGHRDYTLLGCVRVQITDAGMVIANPGGFVEGINVHNLLTAEPHGRNPCLMDALKRIGLAERAGRGIDRIYEGSLRYGRPFPDYSASTSRSVSLYIRRSTPDLAFVTMILDDRNRIDNPMTINGLMVLNLLKNEHRCSFKSMRESLDMSESELRATLEMLTETGLIETSGTNPKSSYSLGLELYRQNSNSSEYTGQLGINRLKYQQLIMQFVSNQGSITKTEVMQLLHMDANQAYYQLYKLTREGRLQIIGSGKKSRYVAGNASTR